MNNKCIVDIDFYEAANRHYRDAELLRGENSLINAGQLYGFAAECGVKWMLVQIGIRMKKNGDIESQDYRKHANHLASMINEALFQIGGKGNQRCIASLKSISSIVGKFKDWKVDYRYYGNNKALCFNKKWQESAKKVIHTIQQERM